MILVDFARTLSTHFRFGTIRLKDVTGVMHVRDAGDTADANLVAAGAKFTGGTPGIGKIWTSDEDGDGSWQPNVATVTGQALFTEVDVLEPGISPVRIYNRLGASKQIVEVYLAVGNAPAGSDLIVDIHKDGLSIFTNQANRPKVASLATTGFSNTIDEPTWDYGSYIEMHIDQVGSTTPGSDLTVHVVYQ